MSTFSLALKYFFIDLIGGILRWPLWWYTKGLQLRFAWAVNSITNYGRMLALGVWIKNIFVPMFGQRDWQSRLISVFMRIVNIVGRSIALFFWTVIVIFLVGVYLVLPIVATLAAIYHLTGNLFV